MIKDIVRDILFLQRKAELATKDDWQVGRDLVDTLESKLDTCAGLAANMIGSTKAVIVSVREISPSSCTIRKS